MTSRFGKRVYFVRHGQSAYNAAGGIDPMIFDAELTDLGKNQAIALQKTVEKLGKLELLVVSPLTRAIQTMHLAFQDRIHHTPIVVCEESREIVTASDDLGSPPELLSQKFPNLDFQHLKPIWWYSDAVDSHHEQCWLRFKQQPFLEPEDIYTTRAHRYIEWIANRSEKVIVAVGHCDMTKQLLGVHLKNCELFPTVFDEQHRVFYPYVHQHLEYHKRKIMVELVDMWSPGTITQQPIQFQKKYLFVLTDLETGQIFEHEQVHTETEEDNVDEIIEKEGAEVWQKSTAIKQAISQTLTRYITAFGISQAQDIQFDLMNKEFLLL